MYQTREISSGLAMRRVRGVKWRKIFKCSIEKIVVVFLRFAGLEEV